MFGKIVVKIFVCFVCSIIVYFGLTVSIEAEVRYTTTCIGSLDGYKDSYPTRLNDNSMIAGVATNASINFGRAFLWNDGTMTNLGTLGGEYSFATGLNNYGMVVGYSSTATGEEHAFLWDGSNMNDLGPGKAMAINDFGKIVGNSNGMAVIWDGIAKFEIGSGNAIGINNAGNIIVDDSLGGYLWDGYTKHNIDILAGHTNNSPFCINEHDIVAGWTDTSAFKWDGANTVDIGSLYGPSMAYGINDEGIIVGRSEDSDQKGFTVLWDGTGTVQKLEDLIDPSLGLALFWGTDINESDQIISYGADPDNPTGALHGYLLTPVPEPASTFLFFFGLCVTGLTRKWYRK